MEERVVQHIVHVRMPSDTKILVWPAQAIPRRRNSDNSSFDNSNAVPLDKGGSV